LSTGTPKGWQASVVMWFAIVLIAVFAAAPVHGHTDTAPDACTLCQVEHSPASLTASGPTGVPPAYAVAAFLPASAEHPVFRPARTSLGRAPPSLA